MSGFWDKRRAAVAAEARADEEATQEAGTAPVVLGASGARDEGAIQ